MVGVAADLVGAAADSVGVGSSQSNGVARCGVMCGQAGPSMSVSATPLTFMAQEQVGHGG
jgi:hypothetical protein